VVAVAEDRLDDIGAVALAAKLLGATERVVPRVTLVVDVVQQAGRPPQLELIVGDSEPVLAVPGDGGLDCQTVTAQGVRLRPVA